MGNIIWVRILIASLALIGEGVLASENNSLSLDQASFIGHSFDTSKHNPDADSDNNLIVSNNGLVSFNLYQIKTCREFTSNKLPVLPEYLLSYPRAPPASLI